MISNERRSMGRREFLARIPVAAAASGLAMGATDVGGRLKIAMFSGMFKGSPLEAAIECAGKIGYDGIEIQVGMGANHLDLNCSAERADEIKRMAGDHNVAVCLIYTTLGGNVLTDERQRAKGLEDVERFLDIGDRMSCKLLKVTAGRLKNSAYRDDEARVVAAWLGAACDRATKHGSRIVAEIHFGQYCETVAMARKIIDLVDRPNFGVIHDAGNLHITGDIYGEESVKVLGDRIFHVHVKDMVKAAADDAVAHDYPAGRFKRAPLNEGNVDHRPLFNALKKVGFKGYLSCEASGGDNPAAVARHEFDEVRKLLGPA
ncbi:MAG TPA: sugar phosphate isomerase/epimerase family protein [Verrucomicrobiae bacterium]|nr:sugar phosphate isomerase/epimerase family protein [Verrucomicrobiae bacterium]